MKKMFSESWSKIVFMIIKKVKFTKETNNFQNKFKKDCKDFKSESKIFAAADKTSNYYKTDPEDYLKLLEKNITKDYKKTEDKKSD